MGEGGRAALAIVSSVVGLAVLSVILSARANTAGVLGAAGQAVSGVIGAATAPVSGGAVMPGYGYGGYGGYGASSLGSGLGYGLGLGLTGAANAWGG